MAQCDIISFLEKQKKPVSRRDIIAHTGLTPRQTSRGLAKLFKFHEVELLEVDYITAQEKYGISRRFNLYYLPDIIKKNKKVLMSEIRKIPDLKSDQKVLAQTSFVCEKPKPKSVSQIPLDSEPLSIVSS